MILREFTQDFTVLQEVYFENEYRLPDRFPPQAVVLDIGAHIGIFALACLDRGAERIECYEPETENFKLLRQNAEPYRQRIRVHQAAVWRSDKVEQARLCTLPGAATASHTMATEQGDVVPTVTLDHVLQRLGEVHLCKMDCEGSEYPILYTSRELRRIANLVGEIHHYVRWEGSPIPCTPEGVERCLRSRGFEVEIVAHNRAPQLLSWFFARRKP